MASFWVLIRRQKTLDVNVFSRKHIFEKFQHISVTTGGSRGTPKVVYEAHIDSEIFGIRHRWRWCTRQTRISFYMRKQTKWYAHKYFLGSLYKASPATHHRSILLCLSGDGRWREFNMSICVCSYNFQPKKAQVQRLYLGFSRENCAVISTKSRCESVNRYCWLNESVETIHRNFSRRFNGMSLLS